MCVSMYGGMYKLIGVLWGEYESRMYPRKQIVLRFVLVYFVLCVYIGFGSYGEKYK